MSTLALDITTIFYALNDLEKEFLGKNRSWIGEKGNREQEVFIGHYNELNKFLPRLNRPIAKASIYFEELDGLLEEHGYSKMFQHSFAGIGVVSILRILIEWFEVRNVRLCTIQGCDGTKYSGFEIPLNGRYIYKLPDDRLLVCLKTKSGDFLWLTTMPRQPDYPRDILTRAFEDMNNIKSNRLVGMNRLYSTVRIPDIYVETQPNISFIQGIRTKDSYGTAYNIIEAYQELRIEMNKEGARIELKEELRTLLTMATKDASEGPSPLIVNKPFLGWLTQKGALPLPLAIFYADYDSWKEVDSLES
jgi:hypothetical protein